MPHTRRFIPFRKSHAVLSFAIGAGLGIGGMFLLSLLGTVEHAFIEFVISGTIGGVFAIAMYLGRNIDRRSTEEEDVIDGPRLHDRIAQELDRDMSDLAGRIPGTFYGDFGRRNE